MNAKTYTLRESEIERRWYVVDADGRDARPARVAHRARPRGQAQADVRAHLDTGDHVIVLNARASRSPRQAREKMYVRHSGYPRGFKEETLGHLLDRRPEEVIRRAVKGMLPAQPPRRPAAARS
jgi:large subunit ribosomal protein L13